MSDYQAQFDRLVTAANDALAEHTTELGVAVPGLHPSHVRRVFENISKMLGSVDRREAKHPEYLAASPRNTPERAIELVAGVPSSLETSTAQFVQNILPGLVQVETRLMNAVGTAAITAENIRNQQVKAIGRLQLDAEHLYNTLRGVVAKGQKEAKEASDNSQAIRTVLASATSDSQKIADVRKIAERLSRGNSGQNPLEALVRSARDRSDEIDAIRDRAQKSEAVAVESANAAGAALLDAEQFKKLLERSNEEADSILRNATQAGLAGAYKTERDKLAKEQNRFALAFYGIIIFIVLYAAVFLVPIFQNLIEAGGKRLSAENGALMLLVRLAVLSPVLWALIFTNRRFRYLETLQMDYAAKTSTALAYSGYIDEMKADPELSKRLKDGLVLRFLEHPSRLLGKKQEVDFSSSGPEGVRVESKSASTNLDPDEEE